MSDNDLIRRGDAVAMLLGMRGPVDVPRTEKAVWVDEGIDRCIEELRDLPAVTPAPDAAAEIDLRSALMEQIEEAASQSPWVPAEYSMNEVISDCCAFLREPIQLAHDAAAIREAALRAARQCVNDLVAERQADLHGARNDFNRGAVDALQEACSAILALIPTKGGDGRRVYMGQIMAECDCPREAECQAAGRCIAEGRR